MQLHFVDRQLYREITQNHKHQAITQPFQPVYILPEGGTNTLAIDSCADYAHSLPQNYDIICCACGTGGTAAGLIKGLNNSKQFIGFPVLKGADFIYTEINKFLDSEQTTEQFSNWSLQCDYHFGGYGRSTIELEDFIVYFKQQHDILLEPVYTGKMLFAIFDLIKKGYFRAGSRILAIHSGGIQGLDGFPALKARLMEE